MDYIFTEIGNIIKIRKILLLLIIILASAFISCGRNTDHCPTSHITNDLSTCYVLDSTNAHILIQHGELDNNKIYFEIIDQKNHESSFQSFPKFIKRLAPEGYSAKIDSSGNIYLNNTRKTMSWKSYKGDKLEKHLF